MANWDWIERNFDRYSRVARLYPSLFALSPFIWSGLALFPTLLDSFSHSATFAVAIACLFYFFASVSRYRGKLVQERLLKRWGGWPTTTLLRHRDRTIDRITKARYHENISKLTRVTMPTENQERQDVEEADSIYQSAIYVLKEKRRTPEDNLILDENTSYGFRRNLLGVKPIAICMTLSTAGLTALSWWLITPQPYSKSIIATSVVSYPYLPILFTVDIGYFFLWIWIVRENFVFYAAKEYAIALLRSLDR
jgi:hypothetical protein